MSSESNWPALLNDYRDALKNFESISAALTEALSAQYPLDADFLDLITAEERFRERVILARMRLINHWRATHDETSPWQVIEVPKRTDSP